MPIDSRGIDHLVVLTHDMDQAVEAYRKMGFVSTSRMLHPFGTANNLIMFENNFLEILGVSDPDKIAGIGIFIKRLLDEREGISHFALLSNDAVADHKEFVDKGFDTIEVSGFEREVELPDGRKINAVVSVCGIQQPDTPRVQIFFSQQHVAEAIWVPEWQQQANGALGIDSVTILAEQPERDFGKFFQKLFGSEKVDISNGDVVANTPNGRVNVLTLLSFNNRYAQATIEVESVLPYVAAMEIRVKAIGVLEDILQANGVPFQRIESGNVLVAPTHGMGVLIEFTE